MIVKLVKSFVKLGFLCAGTAAVVGVWDYTQQAKVAEDEFSFAQYQASVVNRYGDQAGDMFTVAHSGIASGFEWVSRSGVLDLTGLVETEDVLIDGEQMVRTSDDPSDTGETDVEIATADSEMAPQTSLFPRAQVLQ